MAILGREHPRSLPTEAIEQETSSTPIWDPPTIHQGQGTPTANAIDGLPVVPNPGVALIEDEVPMVVAHELAGVHPRTRELHIPECRNVHQLTGHNVGVTTVGDCRRCRHTLVYGSRGRNTINPTRLNPPTP